MKHCAIGAFYCKSNTIVTLIVCITSQLILIVSIRFTVAWWEDAVWIVLIRNSKKMYIVPNKERIERSIHCQQGSILFLLFCCPCKSCTRGENPFSGCKHKPSSLSSHLGCVTSQVSTFPSRWIPSSTVCVSIIFTLMCFVGKHKWIITLVFILGGPQVVHGNQAAKCRILSRTVVISVAILWTSDY